MDICYIITINYLTHRVAFLSFVCSERDFWLLWVLLRGPIHSFACSQTPQVHCVHPRLSKCALLRGQCTHNYQLLYPIFVCHRQWELSGKVYLCVLENTNSRITRTEGRASQSLWVFPCLSHTNQRSRKQLHE